MNTNNYDDEATRFPDSVKEKIEAGKSSPAAAQKPKATPPPIPSTAASGSTEKVVVTPAPKTAPVRGKKSSDGGSAAKNVALGAGAGILMGTAATVLMGMKNANDPVEAADGENGNAAESSHPAWSDGEVPVATSVNDGMSFSEAFAAARAEVGPGGAFEWHGGVYGTYYASEWNSMSAAEKAEYNSHFSWSHGETSTHHTFTSSHHTTSHHESSTTTVTEHVSEGKPQSPTIGGIDGGEEPGNNTGSTVTHTTTTTHTSSTSSHTSSTTSTGHETGLDGDGNVEVIGVYQDDASGYNVGVMNVDNHAAMVIDVDGDMTFDVLAVDMNNDGNFSADEMVDVSDSNLTVADLGGFTDMGENDALLAERGVSDGEDSMEDCAIEDVPGGDDEIDVLDPYDTLMTDDTNDMFADDGIIDNQGDMLI